MANPANYMSLTAFILAAGRGSRMLDLTKNIPKPLLQINGKPMIDYVLGLLRFYGFNRVGINISYQGEKIKKYLANEEIQIIAEPKLSGSAGGILAISKNLLPDSPFLVISSDMMVNFDLSKIYKFHLKKKALATVCCYFRPKSKLNSKKSGQMLFDKRTNEVTQIIERSAAVKSQWVNSSVYVFDPEIIKVLKNFKQQEIDIAKDLLPALIRSGRVFAYPVNSKKYYQLGVDTPERIKITEDDIESGKFVPVIP
jgi:mannose-1-phosphate guanylyltransferase/mannose-1-phosphate guanylyltransferase/phosphomannomutase